jgi:outer membrane immunogenic protein
MKRALATSVGVLTLAALPALAADLPVRIPTKAPAMVASVYNWTGCYLGGYVGGASAGRNVSAQDLNGYNYGGAAGPAFGYKLDSSVIGGGTLGCNYQTGQFVFGLEGEAGYMRLRGSAFDPNGTLPLDTLSSSRIGDWYGMITGRAGVTWDRALLYIKGGVAFADTRVSVLDSNPAGGATITATGGTVRASWTAGGGLEYALSDAWSIKGEYMYIAMRDSESACGTATFVAFGTPGRTFCWSHDLPGVHTAKFGLNYHFNAGPVVARY